MSASYSVFRRRIAVLLTGLLVAVAGAIALPMAAHADPPAGTISIHVSSFASIDPLEGIDIGLRYGDDFTTLASTATDVSGNVIFPGLLPDTYVVTASASGWVQQSVEVVLGTVDGEQVDFVLSEPTGSVSGHVYDEESGDPISGAGIGLDSELEVGGGGPSTTTDASGFFEITGLGAGGYSLAAWATDYAPVAGAFGIGQGDSYAFGDIDLTPYVYQTVSGTVTQTGGAVLGGIRVSVFQQTGEGLVGWGRVTTNSSGFWTLQVPVGTGYSAQFWDETLTSPENARGFESLYLGRAQSLSGATFFDVTEGSPATGKNIQLNLGGRISGHTQLLAPDGSLAYAPGGGWYVPTLFQFVGGSWEAVVIPWQFAGWGGTGDYTIFGIPAGTYRLGAVDQFHAGSPRAFTSTFFPTGASTVESATSFSIAASGNLTGRNFTLQIPAPAAAAASLSDAGLIPSAEDGITPEDTSMEQGSVERVDVGEGLAGEWVSAWAHSTPVNLSNNWAQVRSDGTVDLHVPDNLATGAHQLAVQTAENRLVGWADITIEPSLVSRIAGDSRFTTSAAVAAMFDTADVVYVTSGRNYPDALSAAPAAGFLGGPLLLTDTSELPPAIAAQVVRLQPGRIIVVGGPSTVSLGVEAALEALMPGTQVDRIAGVDRYDTSQRIAEDAFVPNGATGTSAWVATGANFPDALSASAVAGSNNGPVILVNGMDAAVNAATFEVLDDLPTTKVFVAGSTAVVSQGVENSLSGHAFSVERKGGVDRYQTSVLLNADIVAADAVFLAVGTGYADALSGAALAASLGAPLFTVPANCVPQAVLDRITALAPDKVYVLGGPGTLSQAVFDLTAC